MPTQTNYKINIAGLLINVYIDNNLDGVIKFIHKFKKTNIINQTPEATIYILKNKKRKIELSTDWKILSITGSDINDLTDPFTLIGLTQAIFRFAAIHLAKKGVFLLHGSAATFNKKIICFGDDGKSIAKTLGSLEVALTSDKYIADEFCFIDIKTSKISGYSLIPIHLRPEVKDHLQNQHSLKLPPSNYKDSIAGYFIQPNKLFSIVSGKLKILSYIHFSETENSIKKLSTENALMSFKFCIASHIAKLLYPELDRMQFASQTDTSEVKIINENIINDIEEKLFSNQPIIEFIQKIKSYKITVSNPCQIVSQLKAEI